MAPVALQIESVTLDRQFNGGPDVVTLVVATVRGQKLDLTVEVPRHQGEEYVRGLGVEEYRHVEHVPPAGGRGRLGLVDEIRLTATGKKLDLPEGSASGEGN